MMASHCFAPGCKTQYKSDRRKNKLLGQKNPAIFSAPKDSNLLEKWIRAVPRKDKTFSLSDKLCERHFDEKCIIKHFETKLPDGTVFRIERERFLLKPGSIPSKFRNLPKYLSTEVRKRKLPAIRTCVTNKAKKYNLDESSNEINDQEHELKFSTFVKELKNIEMPDPWWTVGHTVDYVICTKWDSEYSCERRVVILQDFSTKIFFRNIQIALIDTSVQNIESLSLLLQKVNRLLICQGIESGSLQNAAEDYISDMNVYKKAMHADVDEGTLSPAHKDEDCIFPAEENEDTLSPVDEDEDCFSLSEEDEDTISPANESASLDEESTTSSNENSDKSRQDKLKYSIFESNNSKNNYETCSVTHKEALTCAETLLCYMNEQDHVDNADCLLIQNYIWKIKEKIFKEELVCH